MIEKVQKPWGKYTTIAQNERCTVKVLELAPFQRTSLQYHNKRDEEWYVLEGLPIVQLQESLYYPLRHSTINVPRKTPHRIAATDNPVKILEITRGYHDEADEVMLEDDYNRVK